MVVRYRQKKQHPFCFTEATNLFFFPVNCDEDDESKEELVLVVNCADGWNMLFGIKGRPFTLNQVSDCYFVDVIGWRDGLCIIDSLLTELVCLEADEDIYEYCRDVYYGKGE